MPLVAGQFASANASATSVAVAFPSANTAGNLLIAGSNGDLVATGLTDSRNTPAQAVGDTHGGASLFCAIHYVQNCGAGANTMTRTQTSSGSCSICVAEFTGVLTSGALDQTLGTAEGFGTAVNSGNVTITQAEELLIGYEGSEGGVTAVATGSYTELTEAGGPRPGMLQYKEVASIAAYNSTSTLSGSSNWVGLIATFKLVVVPITLDQEGWRFRNDDGPEATATWKAAQDTGVTIAEDAPFRLRMLINATGNVAAKRFTLGVKKVGAGNPIRNLDQFQ